MTVTTYLENTVDYNFLGESFQIPKNVESFLVYLYGTTWNTPIENDPSMSHHWYIKIREFTQNNISFLFPLLSFLKGILNKTKK